PLIAYWLSTARPITVRANLLVYFQIVGIVMIASYAWYGVFDAYGLALSLLLGPVFFVAMALGAYGFRGSSDNLYRAIAYVIVAIAALVSLPLFDGLVK